MTPSIVSPGSLEEPTSVTVIVPTRDRAERLAGCLRALSRERAALPGLELIVVDDGSADAEAVAAVARTHDAALVRQDRLGVGAARNAGRSRAQGAVISFTDDDCIPAEGWIANLLEALRAGADVVGGSTHAGQAENRLAVAHQLVSNAFATEKDPRSAFAPSSNLACRRSVLDDVPFVDGYAGVGGEDRDWYAEVRLAGYRVAYAPDAAVYHYPDLTVMTFFYKHFRYGRGAFRFRRKHRSSVGRLGAPSFYGRLLQRAFSAGPKVGALVVGSQIAAALGYASEALGSATARAAR
jgi:glycosyltransferase involved in cell wall biosynthesis